MPDLPFPAAAQLTTARELYVKHEPRYGAWDLARQVIEDDDGAGGRVTSAEAIAALLRTWNAAYYRPRPDKVSSLVADLQTLLDQHGASLNAYAHRAIGDLQDDERDAVKDIFQAFCNK